MPSVPQGESPFESENVDSPLPMTRKSDLPSSGFSDNKSKEKERAFVDKLFASLLTNLELSVFGLAIRVLSKEIDQNHPEEVNPTILVRLDQACIKRENPPTEQEKSDIQCFLDGKTVFAGDLSVHLMTDRYLSPQEFFLDKAAYDEKVTSLNFPFQYPLLNHPSTIALVKAPPNAVSLCCVDKLSPDNDVKVIKFFPSLQCKFSFKAKGDLCLQIEATLPLVEVQMSVSQVRAFIALKSTLDRIKTHIVELKDKIKNHPKLKSNRPKTFQATETSLNVQQQLRDEFVSEVLVNAELQKSMIAIDDLLQEGLMKSMESSGIYPSSAPTTVIEDVAVKLQLNQVLISLFCQETNVEQDRVFRSFGESVTQKYLPIGIPLSETCGYWYELRIRQNSLSFNYQLFTKKFSFGLQVGQFQAQRLRTELIKEVTLNRDFSAASETSISSELYNTATQFGDSFESSGSTFFDAQPHLEMGQTISDLAQVQDLPTKPFTFTKLAGATEFDKFTTTKSTVLEVFLKATDNKNCLTLNASNKQVKMHTGIVNVYFSMHELILALKLKAFSTELGFTAIEPQKKQTLLKNEHQKVSLLIDGIDFEVGLSETSFKLIEVFSRKETIQSQMKLVQETLLDPKVSVKITKLQVLVGENVIVPFKQLDLVLKPLGLILITLADGQVGVFRDANEYKDPLSAVVKNLASKELVPIRPLCSDSSDDEHLEKSDCLLTRCGSSSTSAKSGNCHEKIEAKLLKFTETQSCFRVVISQLLLPLDLRDLPEIVRCFSKLEFQGKCLLNLLAIDSLGSIEKPGEQIQLELQVTDAQLQLYSPGKPNEHSREILKIRVQRLAFGLKFQNFALEDTMNLKADFVVQSLFIIDQEQELYPVFLPGKRVKKATPDVKSLLGSQFCDELAASKDRVLFYGSSDVKPILKVQVQCVFFNEGSIPSRCSKERLQNRLTEIKEAFVYKPDFNSFAIQQLSKDFNEIKANPMRLSMVVSVNNGVVVASPANMSLLNVLQGLSKVQMPAMNREFLGGSLKAEFKNQQLTILKIRVFEAVLIFTPVLKIEEIESVLKEKTVGLEAGSYCKAPTVLLLQISAFTCKVIPNRKFTLNCQSAIVHFLKDNLTANQSWLLQGEEDLSSLFAERGFVQILSLNDVDLKQFKLKRKLNVGISNLHVTLAKDSLQDLVHFSKFADIARIEATQIDDAIEQSVISMVEESQDQSMQFQKSTSSYSNFIPDANNLYPFNEEKMHVSEINLLSVPKASEINLLKTTVSSKSVLSFEVDPFYFEQLKANQVQVMTRRYRKMHSRSKEAELLQASIEVSIEFNLLSITCFGGRDFDFTGEFVSTNPVSCSKIIQSQNLSIHSSDVATRKKDVVPDNSYLAQKVVDKTSERRHTLQKRPRNNIRRKHEFVKLVIKDFLLTRRQYPDYLRQLQDISKTSIALSNREGKKLKTFSLSIRQFCFQHSLATKMNGRVQELLETPFCFRYQNWLEVQNTSEKDYTSNLEEHTIKIHLLPTKLSLTQAPIDFLEAFLPENQSVQNQDDKVSSEKNKPKAEQLIKNVTIVESCFTISIKGVYSTLLQIEDLPIVIRGFRLSEAPKQCLKVVNPDEAIPWAEAVSQVLEFYKTDIINNHKLSLLKSFKPVKRISNGAGSLLGPLYKPIFGAWTRGKAGMVIGFHEGIGDLYAFVSVETYGWSIYLLKKLNSVV